VNVTFHGLAYPKVALTVHHRHTYRSSAHQEVLLGSSVLVFDH